MWKAGDLVYVPAHITLMQFDESIKQIDPNETYVGPSPLRFHELEKPTNLLLLESHDEDASEWLPVLYQGERLYINKHDVLPYQEEKWLD